MKVSDRRKKEKLKLDQMMRVLFRLSKRLMVQLINGLFEEQFATEDVKSIHYGNAEFIMDSYERIVGDLFLTLDTRRGLFHYHVEFQTLNDQSMVIRMFRYGFEKALELAAGSKENGLPLLAFPRQIVIFLEENEAIGEELAFRMRLPDGTETVYTVPVLRYWRDLHRQRLLPTGDMDRILQVLGSILNYLYRHYGEYKQTEEEVSRMIKTFIPEALKKGREEGKKEGLKEGVKEGVKKGQLKVARNLLKLGVDMDTIVEATELTPEEVTSLEAKN